MKEEQKMFQDILQADFLDHYNNLTLKSLFTLKYFLNISNFKNPKDPPKYLAKVDDDSYLNVPELRATLFDATSTWSNITDLLMGSRFNGDRPRRKVTKNKRHVAYVQHI